MKTLEEYCKSGEREGPEMTRKAKRARHKPLFIVEYDDAGFTHYHVLEEFDNMGREAQQVKPILEIFKMFVRGRGRYSR